MDTFDKTGKLYSTLVVISDACLEVSKATRQAHFKLAPTDVHAFEWSQPLLKQLLEYSDKFEHFATNVALKAVEELRLESTFKKDLDKATETLHTSNEFISALHAIGTQDSSRPQIEQQLIGHIVQSHVEFVNSNEFLNELHANDLGPYEKRLEFVTFERIKNNKKLLESTIMDITTIEPCYQDFFAKYLEALDREYSSSASSRELVVRWVNGSRDVNEQAVATVMRQFAKLLTSQYDHEAP